MCRQTCLNNKQLADVHRFDYYISILPEKVKGNKISSTPGMSSINSTQIEKHCSSLINFFTPAPPAPLQGRDIIYGRCLTHFNLICSIDIIFNFNFFSQSLNIIIISSTINYWKFNVTESIIWLLWFQYSKTSIELLITLDLVIFTAKNYKH